jgi:hypothetical protein
VGPVHRSPLRTGRDHRRAHQRPAQRRPRFAQPMRSIRQRPFPPSDRTESGHWEGDVIVGKDQGSSIGPLVERQTRMIRLLHLPQRDSQTHLPEPRGRPACVGWSAACWRDRVTVRWPRTRPARSVVVRGAGRDATVARSGA